MKRMQILQSCRPDLHEFDSLVSLQMKAFCNLDPVLRLRLFSVLLPLKNSDEARHCRWAVRRIYSMHISLWRDVMEDERRTSLVHDK